MTCATQATNLLLLLYRSVKRLGVLEFTWTQRCFRHCYFLYKQLLEDPFHNFVRFHPELFQGGHILDVGANIGYTSLVFARALSAGYKVFAFEPERTNFEALKDSINSYGLNDLVTPIETAVGERDGQVSLWINKNHHGDRRIATKSFTNSNEFRSSNTEGSATLAVPFCTIDFFTEREKIQSSIRFIKIDVEGYEFGVCQGMTKTLIANPAITVAFEFSPRGLRVLGFDPVQVISFFTDRGFNLYRLDRRGTLAPYQLIGLENLFSVRDYVDLIASRTQL